MYGIKENELEWFRSYLTERKVNGTKSSELNNEFGEPQGSILGALLFLICMNDDLKRCKIILCTDDTLIYAEEETDEQCKQYLLYDKNYINYWLKMNNIHIYIIAH